MFFDDRYFENLEKEQQRMRAEFERLRSDPPAKIPQIGDRVIVATGFLAMGHLWARMEAEVMDVGDTSVKVRLIDYQPYQQPIGSYSTWIHPALITDVLKKKKENV